MPLKALDLKVSTEVTGDPLDRKVSAEFRYAFVSRVCLGLGMLLQRAGV